MVDVDAYFVIAECYSCSTQHSRATHHHHLLRTDLRHTSGNVSKPELGRPLQNKTPRSKLSQGMPVNQLSSENGSVCVCVVL